MPTPTHRGPRARAALTSVLLTLALGACGPTGGSDGDSASRMGGASADGSASGPTPGPAAVHLASLWDTAATVEGELPEPGELLQIDWRFDRPWEPLPPEEDEEEEGDDEDGDGDGGDDQDDAGKDAAEDAADGDAEPAENGEASDEEEEEEEEPDPLDEPGVIVHGAEAVAGIEELAVVDGRLHGRVVAKRSALRLERRPEGDTPLHGVEIAIRLPEGGTVGVTGDDEKELDRSELRTDLVDFGFITQTAKLEPSEEVQTVVIELPSWAQNTERIRHLFIQPTDEGKPFELESARLVSLEEHLAKQPANIDWRGLGGIYRQTLLMHVTETVRLDVELPAQPWLELSVGTLEGHPTTFLVECTPEGGETQRLLRRTVTTPERWEEVDLDLSEWAGQTVQLSFRARSDHEPQIAFFGGLAVRNRGALPAVDGVAREGHPRGVIFLLVDTLRRDHLDAYGYGRDTAPYLTSLAAQGVLCEDNISQASWTKVSVPSMLSSLYPTTSGVKSMSDKLPLTATTLAENFQAAGYSTMATSSVVFSGKASNLQQGVDVLHERASVPRDDHPSKTARTYVDRTTEWIEKHQDQPFFVFLHVFDPHSPFDPRAPFDSIWSEEGGLEKQEEDIEKVKEVFDDIQRGGDLLPDKVQFEEAGVDADAFVAREIDWYDESIRALDAEIARLMERLEELGLADDLLLVLTSDHGEEFLEHGRHFHGNSTYGEMTNVPLIFWGPRWVKPSRFPETSQTLDVYPTLLDLCGLPLPEGIQGQSLAPFLLGVSDGWTPRPAVASRFTGKETVEETKDIASFAVVSRGYRLVHNVKRPEGHPEFELYDHVADPLNLTDVADEHPEIVKALAHELDLWLKWTEASALQKEDGDETEALSPEDLEQLRQLGYVDQN